MEYKTNQKLIKYQKEKYKKYKLYGFSWVNIEYLLLIWKSPYKEKKEIIKAIKEGIPLPPITVNLKENKIIDGYHRILICKKLGIKNIPCIFVN